jgi:type IV secretory pathway VirB10-like protein
MRARRFACHLAGYSGAVALIAIGGLTAACGSSATNNPNTATTTTATTIAPTTSAAATAPPPVAPTQNNLNPTGPNLFAPNPNDTPPPAYMPPPVEQNPFTKPNARPPR